MTKRVARLRASRMDAQGGRCYYCAQPMWQDCDRAFRARFAMTKRRAALFRCTAEHLRPRCDGGATNAANIVAACRFCNATRHRARKPKEPVAYRAFVQRRLAAGRWQRVHAADSLPAGAAVSPSRGSDRGNGAIAAGLSRRYAAGADSGVSIGGI